MTSVRLPEEIEAHLNMLCATTQRSKSFYIKEALKHYLEDIADSYVTLDRVNRPDRQFLSHDQVATMIHAMADDPVSDSPPHND